MNHPANPTMLSLAARGQHAALFDRLANRLNSSVGYAFLTVLVPEDTGKFLTRIYSTDPAGHPLGRADKVVEDPWFERLFTAGKPVFAANADEISKWLPDYLGLQGTDYGSLVNFPVVADEQTVGIINLVSEEYAYDAATLACMAEVAPLAAMAIATYVRARAIETA